MLALLCYCSSMPPLPVWFCHVCFRLLEAGQKNILHSLLDLGHWTKYRTFTRPHRFGWYECPFVVKSNLFHKDVCGCLLFNAFWHKIFLSFPVLSEIISLTRPFRKRMRPKNSSNKIKRFLLKFYRLFSTFREGPQTSRRKLNVSENFSEYPFKFEFLVINTTH